jgi:glutamine amidotransferase
VLEQKVMKDKTPVLAICVGLQMFMKSSEEGVEKGLEWIDGYVVRFSEQKMEKNLKIPNMGWLEPQVCKPSALLNNLEDARFYFAHSYHVQTIQDSVNLLTADYGYSFIAAIEYENIKGVQFHPEKSHRFGMQLLKNFALSQ